MPHTSESIKQLLDRSDQAVIRAVYAIQKLQTADEQAGHTTRHVNHVGWSKFDAGWMADMIEKHRRYGSLTAKQIAVTRAKVKRYHRQLVNIANENAQRKLAQLATPATMESVSPDGVSSGHCDCENYDGERLCPACERLQDKRLFTRFEQMAEMRGFASDPDMGVY